jgi:hypothetical protein
LAGSGQRYEALLFTAAAARALSPELLDRLRSDLKAELLRFHAASEEGAVREAVGRVLNGLDLEQLLNVARQRAGEATVWSLPLADGDAWTTAWFEVPPRRDEEAGQRGGREEHRRVVLGATFSALGPVRIDLVSSPEALTVRLLVTKPELVERMRGELRDLADDLVGAAGTEDRRARGRAVQVFVRLGSEAEATLGARPLDIGFLREHRLMDVEG